jgi:hypothetical protein
MTKTRSPWPNHERALQTKANMPATRPIDHSQARCIPPTPGAEWPEEDCLKTVVVGEEKTPVMEGGAVAV